MESREKFADKISKLLAKAESTNSDAEAEALVAKAQEWMTEYAIDEAMIDAARGLESAEKVVEAQIVYRGIFRVASFDIGKVLCKPNDCRHLISNGHNTTTLYVVGFESDVARVKMLDASVQIQAHGALLRWGREPEQVEAKRILSGMQWYKSRREFLFGFANGLEAQLAKARGKAVKTAQAKQSSGPSDSVELVLRDKKARVDDWVDQSYGELRNVSRRYSSGGHGARSAGHAAGQRANASGRGEVHGNARSLPR
jgi:hypothetical protein